MKRPSFIIPKMFRNTDNGKYFNECLMCNRNLLNPPQYYVIEKSIRVYKGLKKEEIIFEYALCMGCTESLRKQLSEESLKRISEYFEKHVNLQRRVKWIRKEGNTYSTWISRCLIKDIPIRNQSEYAVYAQCHGKKMIYGIFPYAVSGKAMEEMNDLLSIRSRQVMDDFIGNYFSGPPEWAEILRNRPVLI